MNKLHFSILIVFSLVLFTSCKSKQNQTRELAPEFSLRDLSGKTHSLSEYRGNVVLLNFWATWCPPCLAELPSLNSIAKKYKSRGLKVVAVSCDSPDEIEKIKKMQSDNSYEFEILLDPEIDTPNKYGVTGFPESFFISRNGEYLDFNDPESKQTNRRIISERQWDSPAIARSIEELLKQ